MRNLRYPLVSNDTILYRADCTRRKVFMVMELVIGSQSFSLVREDYLYATQYQGTKSLSNIRSNYKGELQKNYKGANQLVPNTLVQHRYHICFIMTFHRRCSLVSPIQPLVERLLDFWLMRRIIPNLRAFRNELCFYSSQVPTAAEIASAMRLCPAADGCSRSRLPFEKNGTCALEFG